MRTVVSLLLVIVTLVPFGCAFAAQDGFTSTYTYNYDYWEDLRESPDAYRVETVLNSSSLGLDVPLNSPQSLYVRNHDIYLCDTGNNRIIQIRREGAVCTVTRIITAIQGSEVAELKTPSDCFVDVNDNIYIADTDNHRIVMVDKDLNFIKEFVKPDDPTFDGVSSFLPSRFVVDSSGRVYVQAKNVNKGLVKFEPDTTFTGFIGANKVVYNLAEYIWRKWFMTKEQRSQTSNFVPTEYKNVYIDNDGFIYATNVAFDEYDLKWDAAYPIRRLNNLGNDILIKNDRYPPIGDLDWVASSSDPAEGPSKFYDITVLDNDVYIALDNTRGRLFGFDSQGIMLWAFGTRNSVDGGFRQAASIEHMGYDLMVLDSLYCTLTIFTPTEYGRLIYEASEQYLRGEYDTSADTWREVLKMNANYNLAYRGIGRSLMRQEDYEQAMYYFEMANDRENYGRAFRYYRKIWVEENLWWVAIIIAALLIVPLIRKRIKIMKWEVEYYEHNHVKKAE